jgi:hypothetical protein
MDSFKSCPILLVVLLIGILHAGENVLYAEQLEGITGSNS